MKPMETSGTRPILTIEAAPEEEEMQFSMAEFDYYCNIFESMLQRMEEEELAARNPGNKADPTGDRRAPDQLPDEFDAADIRRMRKRHGIKAQDQP